MWGVFPFKFFSFLVNVYCKKCNLQGNKDDFDFIIPLDKDFPTCMRVTLIRCHAQFVKTYKKIDDADQRPLIYSQLLSCTEL